jgi:hypothetical protein
MQVVRRIDRDLVLSGKMDDPLWQQAAAFPLADADTGVSPHLATAVRLLYSQKYPYFAFVCMADTISAPSPNATTHSTTGTWWKHSWHPPVPSAVFTRSR